MPDFRELMAVFSVPRPNGSAAEHETRRRIRLWLESRRIPYEIQNFRLYPYYFEALGAWLLLVAVLLAVTVWQRAGWWTLLVAAAGASAALLDNAFHLPLVTWPGAQRGENILLRFGPPDAGRELVICAHYDSKTELLDHYQRLFFLNQLQRALALVALLAVTGPLEGRLHAQGHPLGAPLYALRSTAALLILVLVAVFSLNLMIGRLLKAQSCGCVDNGAACAILLGLAERLSSSGLAIRSLKVTLALFGGEEVDRQGSRFFVRSRRGHLPSTALNLEALGQDGAYLYWEQDGSVYRLLPTSNELNQALNQAVRRVTGQEPRPAGPVTSDGASFLQAGVPTAVLGSESRRLGNAGLHSPADNPARVRLDRLAEGVEILAAFIEVLDRQGHC